MVEKVVIDWKYDPKDYFEGKIVISNENYKLDIVDGSVEARVDPEFFNESKDLMNDLHGQVESRFLAVQVMTHKPFKLSKPSRYDLRANGTKNIYLSVEPIVIRTSINADLVVKDKNGNIVSDTKRDRIDKKKWFAETASKFRPTDPTLDRMLRSYNMSVTEPDNELVHLYEIRDAVSKRFAKGGKARSVLNITKDEWRSLGRIANDEPLIQGRHRGQNAGNLRKAELFELEVARKVASKIVENYMKHLENTINH